MALSFPVEPMKATMGSIPAHDGATEPGGEARWAYEIKWDGHRTIAHVRDGRVRFQSTAGHDVTGRWADVAALPEGVHAGAAILDGEMVVFGPDGRPSFDLVQRRSGERTAGAVFQVFDVLQVDGVDTTSQVYLDRRRLLVGVLEAGPRWLVPAHHVGGGEALLAATAEQRLEGVIAKRLDSTYRPGTRSTSWLKVKNRTRTTLTIGGFTTGTGRRSSTFGSLLVGIDVQAAANDPVLVRALDAAAPGGPGGPGLRFAGGVGTGFDGSTLEALTARLRGLRSDACPFDPPPPRAVSRAATWVRPELRAVVDIAEFTNEGLVRHASFVDLAR
ncbi:hypothetical protein [Ilumatobacter sp.]|uniref:ATP-dependent DNA ligase n=1 Tax=Ilumatobacter sp. TaxID=1967498 RepID=UPI003B527492